MTVLKTHSIANLRNVTVACNFFIKYIFNKGTLSANVETQLNSLTKKVTPSKHQQDSAGGLNSCLSKIASFISDEASRS